MAKKKKQQMSRAKEIAKTFKEFWYGYGRPIDEWPDDLWEGVEESIAGIYLEDWDGLCIIDGQPREVTYGKEALEEEEQRQENQEDEDKQETTYPERDEVFHRPQA